MNGDFVPKRCLWSGILIVVLTIGIALPVRADGSAAARTIVVIAATRLAAAITQVVLISVHHRRKKIVITGCVFSAGEGPDHH